MKVAIEKLIVQQDLTAEQMQAVMRQIMSGQATPAQIAGFLVALEMKVPTVTEITAAVEIMREFAHLIELNVSPLIDIVGTGGDQLQTFNISTTCMFVTAAAGAYVAKHGNRAVSSSSGSADVLERAGINLALTPTQAKSCVEKLGIGFLFAPRYHEALLHAAAPRKELGIRTFFNLLGPLTNPAQSPHMLVGVYHNKWLELAVGVLKNLGCKQVLAVHSEDGLDEISIAAPTHVVELKDNVISHYQITPEQFGFARTPLDHLRVNNAAESLAILQAVLNDTPSPARDIVLLNSGAAIYAAGLAPDINTGIIIAKEMLSSGKAKQKLEQLIEYTQGLS